MNGRGVCEQHRFGGIDAPTCSLPPDSTTVMAPGPSRVEPGCYFFPLSPFTSTGIRAEISPTIGPPGMETNYFQPHRHREQDRPG